MAWAVLRNTLRVCVGLPILEGALLATRRCHDYLMVVDPRLTRAKHLSLPPRSVYETSHCCQARHPHRIIWGRLQLDS